MSFATDSRKTELLYGSHAVTMALQNPRREAGNLLVTENARASLGSDLLAMASSVAVLTSGEISRLLDDNDGSRARSVHQGIVYRVAPLSVPDVEEALTYNRLIALDHVEDVGNVGSIIRACAVYGVEAVLIPRHRSVGVKADVAINRIACGGSESVPLIRCGNLAQVLVRAVEGGMRVVGFAEEATQVYGEAHCAARSMLVFGSEHTGLRRITRLHCDDLVKLPTCGTSSFSVLNVAQSVVAALSIEAQHSFTSLSNTSKAVQRTS